MNQRMVNQLDKVLALADSEHEGEAVGAIRMARQLLSRDGLSFGDLARVAAGRSRFSLPLSLFSSQQVQLEAQVVQLQQKIVDLQNDNQSRSAQIEFWRRRAVELEQQLNVAGADTQRWKDIARETAEKLWDIGRLTNGAEFAPEEPVVDESDEPMPRQAVGRG